MNTTTEIKDEKQNKSDPNANKPGYKKTELGWIPSEWEINELKEIIESYRLGGNYQNLENGHGTPLIKMGNLGRGKIKLDKVDKVPNEEIIDRNDELQYNDILFNTRNTLELVGKVAIWKNELPYALYNSNLMRLLFKNHYSTSNEFMNLALNSEYALRQLKSFAIGTTSVAAIYTRDLLKLKLLLPTNSEQQKIAQILSTWDQAIEKTEQLIEKKQRLKKGLMQQLFKGKIRFKEFQKDSQIEKRKIGLVPKEWEVKKASEIFENVSVKNNNEDEELLSATQEYGVVPRNMLEGKVTMPNGSLKSFKMVEKGDFVISLRTFQGGIEYSFYRGLVSPAYTVLKEKTPIDKDFYRHLFKTKDFISRLATSVIGIRDGKQINYSDFKLMKIIYPSIEEQKRISRSLNGIEKEIQLWKKYNEELKQQKKGLMQQLLTGRIRVKT